MDQARAASIVSALADGINPATGEAFPTDSPYQSADVVRALFLAERALEAQRRSQKRSRSNMPPNAGKPWKEEEDRQLLAQFDQGCSIAELAQTLGRTSAGVQVRLEKHGRLQGENGSSRWMRRPASVSRDSVSQ